MDQKALQHFGQLTPPGTALAAAARLQHEAMRFGLAFALRSMLGAHLS